MSRRHRQRLMFLPVFFVPVPVAVWHRQIPPTQPEPIYGTIRDDPKAILMNCTNKEALILAKDDPDMLFFASLQSGIAGGKYGVQRWDSKTKTWKLATRNVDDIVHINCHSKLFSLLRDNPTFPKTGDFAPPLTPPPR